MSCVLRFLLLHAFGEFLNVRTSALKLAQLLSPQRGCRFLPLAAYTCHASDEAKVPRGLSVLSTKSTSVLLQWQLPQDQSDGLSSFSVEYYSQSGASAGGAVHYIPVSVLQYSLDNLEPFTFYTIRVVSVYGTERFFSESVNVTTLEDGEPSCGCTRDMQ